MKLLTIITIATIFALSSADLMSDSLAAHHKYRAPLGIQDLTWNSTLAKNAQTWADYLARNKKYSHSTNRVNVGENIAYGSANSNNAAGFVDLWAEESEDFVAGQNYPQCSSTGDQADVWHYTQMIWEKSTQLGCGLGTNAGKLFYVCQYNPSGNIYGEPVYSGASSPSNPVSQEPEEPVWQEPEEVISEEPEQTQVPVNKPEQSTPTTHSDSFITESLAAHHKWRSAAGVPDLVWDTTLAKNAQAWADNLAIMKTMSYSKDRVNTGENISYGTLSTNTVTGFVGLWGAEGKNFVAGRNYPQCTTGSESDVWHYTQLVWRQTTKVGCGLGTSNGRGYYVCQYYPKGNIIGQPVY